MIYLVRHGQTNWNIEKKTQGHTDIPLNEVGLNQARELSNKIKELKINKIITSDLSRAKETARIINNVFNTDIIEDKRLREINYGNLEGISRNLVTSDMWDTFNLFPEKLNAEPKINIFNRVKNFFDENISNSDENILIVTHGGLLRMIMYYINNNKFDNNLYLKEFNNIKINNMDIFELDMKNKTIKRYKNEE